MFAALLGIAALAVSFVWPLLDDGKSAWSGEQARDYSAAATRLKELSFSPPTPQRDAEIEQVEAEYQQLSQRLEGAKSRGARVAWTLRVAGVVLLLPAIFRVARSG